MDWWQVESSHFQRWISGIHILGLLWDWIMLWGVIWLWLQVTSDCDLGALTAQYYVSDILHPHVLPLLRQHPGAFFPSCRISSARYNSWGPEDTMLGRSPPHCIAPCVQTWGVLIFTSKKNVIPVTLTVACLLLFYFSKCWSTEL